MAKGKKGKTGVIMMRKGFSGINYLVAGIMFLLCLVVTMPIGDAKAEVTRIILVRHGQTDYNVQDLYQGSLDIPLNETGLMQADMLAESIKELPIDVFISSPLERAYVTTEKCAKAKGMEISYTDPRLTEISYGEWEGRTKKEVSKENKELAKKWKKEPWNTQIPGGETLQQLQERYRAAIDDAVERYPGKTIFIGAHSKGNMALMCSILGIGLDHYLQFKQDNTCINVLEYKKGQWKLVLLNSIAHTGKLYK